MAEISDNPTRSEVIKLAITGALAQVETALPARVMSYDSATQKATVQPLIQGAFINADGERVYMDLPPAPNCPVVWPGGGSSSITMPLEVGDRVLLVCASRDISGWLTDDSERNQPLDPRRHALSDAFVIPQVNSFRNPLPSDAVDPTDMVLRATGIKLGSASASQAIAIASLVAAEVNQWISTIHDTHTHTTTGPPTGVPIVVGSSVSGAAMESSKVKAE